MGVAVHGGNACIMPMRGAAGPRLSNSCIRSGILRRVVNPGFRGATSVPIWPRTAGAVRELPEAPYKLLAID